MKQSREIKSFIFGQYFSDGLRITVGVLLPSLIFYHLDLLHIGLTISLGAVCISIADSQGPVNHKRNGMLYCTALVFITALLTGLLNQFPFLIGLEILVLCFLYSMLSVYGNRASSIGTAALLVMILSIDQEAISSNGIWKHSLLILSGGIWYMILSLSLSQIRPFRLAQQAMGECIREVAGYVKLKADFYDIHSDFDENYKKLIAQQVIVHEQQDSVRELLFKIRLKVRESTPIGRLLIVVFVDIVDLFEQTMATHYDYLAIRKNYGSSAALREFNRIIIKMADELENLSYYIISNETPKPLHDFKPELEKLKASIDETEALGINVLVLKKILINVRNMLNRVEKIYAYFNQKQISSPKDVDFSKFVSHQDYDFKIFKENLNLKSSVFRHSVRVALMCLTGFLISKLFPVGYHSYWILLTILVILKPAYSLSKQRNIQRVIGTVIGGLIGAFILYLVKDQTSRFILLLIFMVGTYSFQRLNYIVSVLFMTPYILILFSVLGANNINIVKERVLDTFIGSFVALVSSFIVLPNWEYYQLKDIMKDVLIANYKYLHQVAERLSGKTPDITTFKLVRKDVYVSSANLGSAFQRMLSEPKSKQQNIKEIHKFVVLNHMISSYIATLIMNLDQYESTTADISHIRMVRKSLFSLSELIKSMGVHDFEESEVTVPEIALVPNRSNDSQLLYEQLELVNKLIQDLQKLNKF